MKSFRWIMVLSVGLLFILACHRQAPPIEAQQRGAEDNITEQILQLNSVGVVLMEQFKFQEAAEKFREILEMDEQFVPAYVNLGIAHFNRQDYNSALRFLRRAIELEPDEAHAHYVQGLIYRNQDRVEEAINGFLKVSQQDPDDPSTNYFLGLLYSRQKDYQNGIRYLERVISKEPYNASARYSLATVLIGSGEREKGTEEMNEFRRLRGLFGSTTIGLQYLEQGKYARAIDDIAAQYFPRQEEVLSGDQIEVTFAEIAEEAGLRFRHAGPGQTDLETKSREDLEDRIVPYLGSGIAFGDYDRDGWTSLLATLAPKKRQARCFATKAMVPSVKRPHRQELNTLEKRWLCYGGISIMTPMQICTSSTTVQTCFMKTMAMALLKM